MPIVFDDIDRGDQGPPTAGETHFSDLNRSGRIEAERVRTLVEDWISRYPPWIAGQEIRHLWL